MGCRASNPVLYLQDKHPTRWSLLPLCFGFIEVFHLSIASFPGEGSVGVDGGFLLPCKSVASVSPHSSDDGVRDQLGASFPLHGLAMAHFCPRHLLPVTCHRLIPQKGPLLSPSLQCPIFTDHFVSHFVLHFLFHTHAHTHTHMSLRSHQGYTMQCSGHRAVPGIKLGASHTLAT